MKIACSFVAAAVATASVAALSAQGRTGALGTSEIQAAIDFGLTSKSAPQPYVMRYAAPEPPNRSTAFGDQVGKGAAAAVYTPFIRIAMAADAARFRGQILTPETVPSALAAAVVHIAVSAAGLGGCSLDQQVPLPTVVFVPNGTSYWFPGSGYRDLTLNAQLLPEKVIHPTNVSAGSSKLKEFDAPSPPLNVEAVAEFPIDVLRPKLDFLIMKWVDSKFEGPDGCLRRGRIPTADFAKLR